ncbi:urate hydroxylase PuuD, partial [Edaphovirga cremea]|uniref:urate hydroxylase PuuD n=1 Tax=Edaphovirga cremea TaxID=2267246 RepID=UPI003989B4C3
TVHLPISLAMFQDVFHQPDSAALMRIILRWLHFVGGITWIGLLYFFNLINVPFQKGIDADTKKKVNPDLLGRALWFFRWSAVVTVLAGLMYFAMYILSPDVRNANTIGGGNLNVWWILLAWLSYPVVLFIVEFLIIKKVPALIKDGRVFAIVMFILVAIVTWGLVKFFTAELTVAGQSFASNKTYSIGIGGAYGILMMLNVWGIIWPNNKRILAATAGTGPAAAPELPRQAFIASRTNAWLSLPMLLFMGTSHGDWVIFGT